MYLIFHFREKLPIYLYYIEYEISKISFAVISVRILARRNRKPTRLLLLAPLQRTNRLTMTHTLVNWTLKDWKLIEYTVELRFQLLWTDGRVWVWHIPPEVGRGLHTGISMFSIHVILSLISAFCVALFRDHFYPMYTKNTVCHGAQVTQNYFEKHSENFRQIV